MEVLVRLALAAMFAVVAHGDLQAANAGAAGSYCSALGEAVDGAAPGAGPVFVASYRPGPAETALPGALSTAAFSYDDALTAIALVACGDWPRASRIGDAFVIASANDRAFRDGRVRNAYQAGPVSPGAVKLSGWWDEEAKRWDEDAYQDGTSTGNVAWVALALLNLHEATGRPDYLKTATALLGWVAARTASAPGPAGYAGGQTGFDDAQHPLTWKSTEHNIDVAAAATWAHRLTGEPAQAAMAEKAAAFVRSRFRTDAGYFILGTKPDGSDADPAQLALDVQVWPVLGVSAAPAPWKRAIGFADAHLRRGDGMTFAGIGPNRWTEGTAQAALAFAAVGGDTVANGLLDGLPAHVSPSGLLYATSAGEVSTGLLVEADGGSAFKYFHRPHLGATAWAALAALRWNPFTGRKVG